MSKIKIKFLTWIFIKNVHNFLKISQQFALFVQTWEKITHGLLTFLEKFPKIMNFCNYLKRIFENIWRFSQSFQHIVFFVQRREKVTHDLLNSLKNLAIFFRKFLKIQEIFSKFATNCVFPPNLQRGNASFVKYFEMFRRFLEEKYEKYRKSAQKFPTNCVFRPNARIINAWFGKVFERFSNFTKKILEKSRKFSQN